MTGAWIRRNIVLPAWDGLRGYSTHNKLRELEVSQWLSPDEISDLQWNRLRKLLHHAWDNVPYYRQAMVQVGVTPDELADSRSLEPLPTLTKTTIYQQRDQLIGRNIPISRHIENSTSGSTGEPLRFLEDRCQESWSQAATWRAQAWSGASLGERHAYLWGSDFDVSVYEGLAGQVRSTLWNRLTVPAWRLSKDTALPFLEAFRRYRPRVLVGYAGALYHWARLLEFKRHTIPGLRGIVSTAENLFDEWRTEIEATFGVPVFDRYGARDLKIVGQECPEHKGLHITAENCYLEILQGERPAPPGELGEIVITRLENPVMPFIRYRTGDLGVTSGQNCSCGRGLPLLDRVEGRVQDALQTPDGRVITGPFFGRLMRQCPEIVEYQVHQTDLTHLLIKVVTNPPRNLPSRGKIKEAICDYLGDTVLVEFELVDEIPLTKSGKRRFIISHLDS